MSNEGILTGELEHDSPQLLGHFKRNFPAALTNTFKELYHDVWKHGGCSEETPRFAGVSYNPIPARIGSLLIQDAKILEPYEIQSALLSCIPEESLRAIYDATSREEVLEALNICSNPDLSKPLHALTRMAFDLDEIRHLHLRSLSSMEIASILEQIKMRFESYKAYSTNKLFILFSAALDRALKTLV